MGAVEVEVRLENAFDRERAWLGEIAAIQIRSATVRAVADSGARMLVLPQELVDALGLREVRKVRVRYADQRTEERPVACMVTVQVSDREARVECIVGPPNGEVLLGQIELEAMDLLVDCAQQKLIPRPESPFLPLIPLL